MDESNGRSPSTEASADNVLDPNIDPRLQNVGLPLRQASANTENMAADGIQTFDDASTNILSSPDSVLVGVESRNQDPGDYVAVLTEGYFNLPPLPVVGSYMPEVDGPIRPEYLLPEGQSISQHEAAESMLYLSNNSSQPDHVHPDQPTPAHELLMQLSAREIFEYRQNNWTDPNINPEYGIIFPPYDGSGLRPAADTPLQDNPNSVYPELREYDYSADADPSQFTFSTSEREPSQLPDPSEGDTENADEDDTVQVNSTPAPFRELSGYETPPEEANETDRKKRNRMKEARRRKQKKAMQKEITAGRMALPLPGQSKRKFRTPSEDLNDYIPRRMAQHKAFRERRKAREAANKAAASTAATQTPGASASIATTPAWPPNQPYQYASNIPQDQADEEVSLEDVEEQLRKM